MAMLFSAVIKRWTGNVIGKNNAEMTRRETKE